MVPLRAQGCSLKAAAVPVLRGHPHASICHSQLDCHDPETLFSEDTGLGSRRAGATIPCGTGPRSRWEGLPGEGYPHLSFQTGVTCSVELRAALTRPRSNGETSVCKAGFLTRYWKGRGQNAVRVGVAGRALAAQGSWMPHRLLCQVSGPFCVFWEGQPCGQSLPVLPNQPTRWGFG